MTLHTSMKTGARVLCILNDGTHIIDHFVEAGSKAFKLRKTGRVRHADVRALTYYKKQR